MTNPTPTLSDAFEAAGMIQGGPGQLQAQQSSRVTYTQAEGRMLLAAFVVPEGYTLVGVAKGTPILERVSTARPANDN